MLQFRDKSERINFCVIPKRDSIAVGAGKLALTTSTERKMKTFPRHVDKNILDIIWYFQEQ